MMVNVVGTQALLTRISASAAKPIVWLGGTFYEREVGRVPALMQNAYIATKHASALLAAEWARRFDGAVVFGRIFQAYGPGDDAGNVLTYAAHQLKRRVPAQFGSGRGQRDWIFVDDVADGIMASVAAARTSIQTFEIGTGKLVSIRHTVEMLADFAGASRKLLLFDPARDRNDPEVEMVATNLPPAWSPQVTLADGLHRLLASA